MTNEKHLEYHFGKGAALIPFFIFIVGVVTVALLGAPDERSFWPILFLSITVGILLAKDKTTFGETVFEGMSQKLVPLMITAWITASCIGILMSDSGLVDSFPPNNALNTPPTGWKPTCGLSAPIRPAN